MERLSGPCDLDRDEKGVLSTSLQWSHQDSTPSSLDIKCLSGESELNCATNNDQKGGGIVLSLLNLSPIPISSWSKIGPMSPLSGYDMAHRTLWKMEYCGSKQR